MQGEEIRAEGRGRNDLFLLNDKSQVQQVEGGRYGRWGCDSEGSEGREVFLEEMTVQIRARDRGWLICPDQTGKVVLPLGRHAGEDMKTDVYR